MTRTTDGSCQCGTVKFQVSGEFERFVLCHCSRCRKDTGSAHAANLFSTTATLTWLSGQDSVRTYRIPGTRHERSFCAVCGAAVPSVRMNGALLVVPAGSLDSAVDIRPEMHIYVASRADWDEGLDAIPKLDGLPG